MAWFGAVNPIVLAILRSRFHGLMSKALLVLTVRGLRTGKEFSFPVMYAHDGEDLVVIAAWASKKRWWKNIGTGNTVSLVLQGEPQQGRAVIVADGAERGRLLRSYTQRFPSSARSLGLLPVEQGSDEELSTRLKDAVVVHIRRF